MAICDNEMLILLEKKVLTMPTTAVIRGEYLTVYPISSLIVVGSTSLYGAPAQAFGQKDHPDRRHALRTKTSTEELLKRNIVLASVNVTNEHRVQMRIRQRPCLGSERRRLQYGAGAFGAYDYFVWEAENRRFEATKWGCEHLAVRNSSIEKHYKHATLC
jgi:hypothetical protein